MKEPIADLLDHLLLERLEENLFRGDSRSIGYRSVFGGQVLGQALTAAARTVEGRLAHSFHAYFLLPGDTQAPIIYDVERIRDGRSFTTRRVVAIQHGRAIFNMAASFQIRDEGIEHQAEMPRVPEPEELRSKAELNQRAAQNAPEKVRSFLLRQLPIEFRPVRPTDPLHPQPQPPQQQMWLRAVGPLPDDPQIHQAILAYASDFPLLGTALLPHGLSFLQKGARAASLDHAMWFHRDFRVDEWLLYAMESPSASNARGLSWGRFFTRDGELVASTAQEGMIRRP